MTLSEAMKTLGLTIGKSRICDIKPAYRNKAKLLHPDKPGGDEAKFKKLNEAYCLLTGKTKPRAVRCQPAPMRAYRVYAAAGTATTSWTTTTGWI